jgi:predicted small secreted protein
MMMPPTSRRSRPLNSFPRTTCDVVICIVLPALMLLSLTTRGGCSTTEGFGDDIQHLGGNIEDSAARNK